MIAVFIFLTVKFFQSLVSSECSRLVEAATKKLSVKVEEQSREIKKLKAFNRKLKHLMIKQGKGKILHS